MKDDYQFNALIEHPEQQAPPGEAPAPDAIGLYLTKKERKKMRRLNRKEVQKEVEAVYDLFYLLESACWSCSECQ